MIDHRGVSGGEGAPRGSSLRPYDPSGPWQGLIFIAPVAGLVAALWAARLLALSAIATIAVTVALLGGALLAGGVRVDWLALLRRTLIGWGLFLLVAFAVGYGAWTLAEAGGPDLIPARETLFSEVGGIWNPAMSAIALPLVAGVAAATWWLHARLPATPFPAPMRCAAIILILLAAPVAGAWLARTLLALA